jgi:hypothetical protein
VTQLRVLKGSEGTFRPSHAQELAGQLAMSARQGRLGEAPASLAALETELERLTTTRQTHAAPATLGARQP